MGALQTPIERINLAHKRPYLISGMLPADGVHLIAGPSGAGKTTWQFQMLQEFAAGLPVLGHETHPGPVFYIAADRSDEDILETMERVGVAPDAFPWASVLETSHDAMHALSLVPPGTKLVMIEGMASLVPDGRLSDYKIVASFLKDMMIWSRVHKCAILGSVHATKTKEGEKFENPRQRILGSVAWAAFSGNIILIEPDKPKDIRDRGRNIMVLSRNGAEELHAYEFNDMGRLQPRVAAPEEARRLVMLSKLPNTATFTRAEAMEAAKNLGVTPTTIDRWLTSMVVDGYIAKTEVRGEYVRAVPAFDGSKLLPASPEGAGQEKGDPERVPVLTETNSANAADYLD